MLIEQTLFGEFNKVEYAIKQLQLHEPKDGYYVAFSGGKDSIVCLDLVKKSGVKYDIHHNITNIEPPELITFIHENYKDVIEELPKETFWQLVIKNGVPPTRIMRYCCKLLKENSGEGRFKVIGIRHSESVRRSKRRFIEPCAKNTGTRFIAPIIEWSDTDVWEYIKKNNLKYPKLYDEGWSRIGCLFCPNASKKERELHCKLYPKFQQQFIRTFDKMIEQRKIRGLQSQWKNGEECFNWWLGNDDKTEDKETTLFSPIDLS